MHRLIALLTFVTITFMSSCYVPFGATKKEMIDNIEFEMHYSINKAIERSWEDKGDRVIYTLSSSGNTIEANYYFNKNEKLRGSMYNIYWKDVDIFEKVKYNLSDSLDVAPKCSLDSCTWKKAGMLITLKRMDESRCTVTTEKMH